MKQMLKFVFNDKISKSHFLLILEICGFMLMFYHNYTYSKMFRPVSNVQHRYFSTCLLSLKTMVVTCKLKSIASLKPDLPTLQTLGS